MDLPLPEYCERGLAPEFWAEPINALTNAGFLIVGAFFLARGWRAGRMDVALPAALLICVGIGSFLFHTWRNSFTLLLDALPIYLFALTAGWLVFRRVFRGRQWMGVIVAVVLLQVVSLFAPADFLNGSARHLLAVVTLLALAPFVSRALGRVHLIWYLGIVGCYAFAVTMRTIDMALCEGLPMGTHVAWHLGAAAVGFCALRLLELLDQESLP